MVRPSCWARRKKRSRGERGELHREVGVDGPPLLMAPAANLDSDLSVVVLRVLRALRVSHMETGAASELLGAAEEEVTRRARRGAENCTEREELVDHPYLNRVLLASIPISPLSFSASSALSA